MFSLALACCAFSAVFAGAHFGGRPSLGHHQQQGFQHQQTQFHFAQPSQNGFAAQTQFAAQRPSRVSPPIVPPTGAQDCITQPGQWTECSKSCGGGIRSRQLIIVRRPTGYGKQCPDLHPETENCNPQPCPEDCVIEPGQFGACSATCDHGVRTKIDIIIREGRYGGKECPEPRFLTKKVPCVGLPPCPVPQDCVIGYSEYSTCSTPCGPGIQTRTAYIVTPALNGGAPCPADLSILSDTRECNLEVPCATSTDCEYITGAFSQCSAPCGTGIQKAQIYIIAQPTNGGRACPSGQDLYITKPCHNAPCLPPVDCKVEWGPYSYCTKTCGGGSQTAQGRIVQEAINGGAPCPYGNALQQTRSCNTQQCLKYTPRDCEVEYGAFSYCSKTCGGGIRTQKAYIKREPEFGGLACPALNELIKREPCNQQPCAVIDCKVERGYWSECSAPCGGGIQTRTLTVTQYASNGGAPCPVNNEEQRPCNTQACAAPVYSQF